MNSRSQVDAILADVGSRAHHVGVKAETHAVTGDAANAIISLAEELDAGLIVVGNKGLGSMRRFVLGNVPSKVVHHSPCSTHIVPGEHCESSRLPQPLDVAARRQKWDVSHPREKSGGGVWAPARPREADREASSARC